MANHDTTSSDFKYDVFLSFRGETRYGFTGHLYNALYKSGINTFMDDEKLRTGDEIKPILLEAIEKSRMSIVVLSENYASSTWCLDELAKISECFDKKSKPVIPIFYKVHPSDVRRQLNSYETAMTKHEKRYGEASEEVKAWRSALTLVSELRGYHFKDMEYEFELIKKIVEYTSAKLPHVPFEIKNPVGLESRFEQVKPLIDIESQDTVRMLGIYGPSGIGKTVLLVDLYNKIKHRFEVASFLSNVSEKSNDDPTNGLAELQQIMLHELCQETRTKGTSIYELSTWIKRRLQRKRVLLILDDVDDINQLKTLAGRRNWFGHGSRIIITTRDTTVLDQHYVYDEIEKYEMVGLNYPDSLELFCWYAFNMSKPAENFENISSRVVSYAKGFPSVLKSTGSHLKGLSVEDCEMELDKFEKVPLVEEKKEDESSGWWSSTSSSLSPSALHAVAPMSSMPSTSSLL